MKNNAYYLLTAFAVAGCSSAPSPVATETPAKSGAEPPVVAAEKTLSPAPKDATALIKWSMDHYASLPFFEAEETLVIKSPSNPGSPQMQDQKRTLLYQKPNLYKVVATRPSVVQTSISDGKKSIDINSMTNTPFVSTAPESISEAKSMQMMHPMFCGSLLYQFFGGSANYDKLVDASKGEPTLGKEEPLNGEMCQDVKFYSVGQDGNAVISIGEKDGLVHKITYDSAPLVQMMGNFNSSPASKKLIEDAIKKMAPGTAKDKAMEGLAKMNQKKAGPMTMQSTETFDRMSVPISVPPNSFDTTPPKGSKPIQMPPIPPIKS